MSSKYINLEKFKLYSQFAAYAFPLIGLVSLGRYGAYITFGRIPFPLFFTAYFFIICFTFFLYHNRIRDYFKSIPLVTAIVFSVILELVIRGFFINDTNLSVRDGLYDLSIFFILLSVPVLSIAINRSLKKLIGISFIIATFWYGVLLISSIYTPVYTILNPFDLHHGDNTIYKPSAEIFAIFVAFSLLLIADIEIKKGRYLFILYLALGIFLSSTAGSRLGFIMLCVSSLTIVCFYKNIRLITLTVVVFFSVALSISLYKLSDSKPYAISPNQLHVKPQINNNSNSAEFSSKGNVLQASGTANYNIIDKFNFNLENGSFAGRIQTWNIVMRYFIEHPIQLIVGDGLGTDILVRICNNYADVYNYKYQSDALSRYTCPAEDTSYVNPLRDPHNFFINQFLHIGLIGITAILSLYYKFYNNIRNLKLKVNLYLILFIVSLSTTMMSSPIMLIPISYMLSYCMKLDDSVNS